MRHFSGHAKLLAAVLFSLLLVSASYTTSPMSGFVRTAYATDYSSLTDAELISEFFKSSNTMGNITNIMDEAIVFDITNHTTLNLRNKVAALVAQNEVDSDLLGKVDVARTVLNNTNDLFDDLNEGGTQYMLNATDFVLAAFISSVQAQRGSEIDTSIADDLIQNATSIRDDMQKRGRELSPVFYNTTINMSVSGQLLNRSSVEIQNIQDIVTELRSRGFEVTVEAETHSPWRIVFSIARGTLIALGIIQAGEAAIELTDAVDEALIANGESPLKTDERLALLLFNSEVIGEASEMTSLAAAKTIFKKIGEFLATDTSAQELASTVIASALIDEIIASLEETEPIVEFEVIMVVKWRETFANKILTGTFEDLNGNHVDDAFDPGISNWNITLYKLGGTKLKSMFTDVDGLANFKGLVDGNYTIVSEIKSGWNATTSTSKDIELEAGHRETNNNDFGFFRSGQIQGSVFNDADNDGTLDASEHGLSGWTISLKNATTGTIIQNTTTTSTGAYSFINLRPGNYTVQETQKPGFTQTYPASGNYSISITSNANITSRDFGNNYPLTGGLLAHWKFDEGTGSSAADSSGSGNTASLSGPTWQSSSSCAVGNSCLSFDGSNDIATPGALNFGTSSFSISLWFKSTQSGGGDSGFGWIVDHRRNNDGAYVGYTIGDDSGTISGRIRDGSAHDVISSSGNYNNGNWHHMVFVVDRSAQQQRLYVDNILRDSDGISSVGSITTSHSLNFGGTASPNTLVNFFSGSLDQIRFYNKVLTTTDIEQLYLEH